MSFELSLLPLPESRHVIIGGAGGIGFGLVKALHNHGVKLCVMDLPEALSRRDFPDGVQLKNMDLHSDKSVKSAFEGVSFGKIDGLSFCAGYTKGFDKIEQLDMECFDDIFSGNLRGAALALKHAKPLMAERSAMVFLSTAIGQIGAPGYAGYGAAKMGLNALIRTAAAEFAPMIRVNGVAPGAVDTAFIRGGFAQGVEEVGDPQRFNVKDYAACIPLGRMADVDDIIGPLLFLLSPASRYMTGQVIHVNGGGVMRD